MDFEKHIEVEKLLFK